MESLMTGNLILPLEGSLCRYGVQRRSACRNHSGLIAKPIPRSGETVRLPAGITVRLQPVMLFTFAPESFSPSPGIRNHPAQVNRKHGTPVNRLLERVRPDRSKITLRCLG